MHCKIFSWQKRYKCILFFESRTLETTLELKRQLGLVTAIFIIIADVIGTGIFVTTGSVLGMTGNAFIVLLLWGIGGIVAITGALCYAELAVMWPDVGITKGDLAAYVMAVGDPLIHHIGDRPVTLQRFPDGIEHVLINGRRVIDGGRYDARAAAGRVLRS